MPVDTPTSAEMKLRFAQVEQVYGGKLIEMLYAGAMRVTEVTADDDLDADNEGLVLCNKTAGLTLTLPAAADADGMFWLLKHINTAGTVTVHTADDSDETIDGVNSDQNETGLQLATMDMYGIYCDGTEFWVFSHVDPDNTALTARVAALEADADGIPGWSLVTSIAEAGNITFMPADEHQAMELTGGRVVLLEVPDAAGDTITVVLKRSSDDAAISDTLTFTEGVDGAWTAKDFTPEADAAVAADESVYATVGGTSTTLGAIDVRPTVKAA